MAIESKMSRPPLARPVGDTVQKKGLTLPLLIIVLVAVVAVGWWYFFLRAPTSSSDILSELQQGSDVTIDSSGYQAVFIDNGQVYFGKLQEGDDWYTLTDVFYLNTCAAGVDSKENLSLAKLGNEVHGPEDAMRINKEHVLFVEKMKSDSKVVQAIINFKSGKK